MKNLISGSAKTPQSTDEDSAKRSKVPLDVWDWQNFEVWRETIWMLIEDIVDGDVKSAFLDSPPEYVVGDDLSWLNRIIADTRNIEVDSKSHLARKIRGHFRVIRAAHGTRIDRVESFYADGLMPLRPDVIHQRVRDVFLSGQFPELSERHLLEAIKKVKPGGREGQVWFEANEQLLLEQCGHYMVYGGEYLTSLAAHLGPERDYRQILKGFGQPTVFVCDVPLDFVREFLLEEFSGRALELIFQELLDGEDYVHDIWRGAGVCIYQNLPASCIVGHYHPVIQRDPLLPGSW